MAFKILVFVFGVLLHLTYSHPNVHANFGNIRADKPIELAPYVASLQLGESYLCGAAIVKEQFVLSAASCCLEKLPHKKLQVLVGTNSIDASKGTLLDVDDVLTHDKFDENTGDYDICLIRLKEPLAFNEKVGRLDLPDPDQSIKTNTKFNLTGWFTEPFHNVPEFLQFEIEEIDADKCNEICIPDNPHITSHKMCAGIFHNDISAGDTGNPLSLGNEIVGITSLDFGCGRLAGVYTKISSVLCWISEKMALYP